MQLNKSEYDSSLYYIGYDDSVSEGTIMSHLLSQYGLEDGRDFDGIERRDCDITDAHTDADADTISDLIGCYDSVERVYLRAVRA